MVKKCEECSAVDEAGEYVIYKGVNYKVCDCTKCALRARQERFALKLLVIFGVAVIAVVSILGVCFGV